MGRAKEQLAQLTCFVATVEQINKTCAKFSFAFASQ